MGPAHAEGPPPAPGRRPLPAQRLRRRHAAVDVERLARHVALGKTVDHRRLELSRGEVSVDKPLYLLTPLKELELHPLGAYHARRTVLCPDEEQRLAPQLPMELAQLPGEERNVLEHGPRRGRNAQASSCMSRDH